MKLARRFEIEDSIRPDQLPAEFRKLGLKVAVVTNSNQRLAIGLLKQFGIEYDTLVAYRDTKEHKPAPEPFLLALERLGVAPKEAISIGDDWADTKAAYHAGIFPVGAAWGVSNWLSFAGAAAEVTFHKPSRILDFANYDRRRYLGEVIYRDSGDEPLWHRGSLIWVGPNRTVGFCLGRYYNTNDSRHGTSELSKRILECKDDADEMATFAHSFVMALIKSKVINDYQFPVCVPPKPGQENRFEKLLTEVDASMPRLRAYPAGLSCGKDYGNIKGLKPDERRERVRGAFRSTYDWDGRGVILFDDVLTSGATTMECVETLKRNGAGEVLIAAIGKDQSILDKKICPNCNRMMKMRKNSYTGQNFWGCTGYRATTNPCSHTEKLVTA